MSALEMTTRILRLMGSPLEPRVLNEASNEIRNQFLSAEKARRMLDWAPSYSLDDALRETIRWYCEYFTAADDRSEKPRRSPAHDNQP